MRHYLVVDDNRDFAENLAEIVRDRGEAVTVAGSGDEALRLAAGLRFDCLVTDMRMPFMGGAELVHRLRRVDPGLPAVVVTAHVGDDELERARQEGLLAVLPKPVPIPRLLELLGSARRDALVVVVEDDVHLSDNLTEALRTRGIATVTAVSVTETERLGPIRPFAALVDLRVPGGPDGEAMRRLRARFPDLPLIVVTAFDDPPPVPFQALFAKPFDTAALLDAVDELHARGARAGAR